MYCLIAKVRCVLTCYLKTIHIPSAFFNLQKNLTIVFFSNTRDGDPSTKHVGDSILATFTLAVGILQSPKKNSKDFLVTTNLGYWWLVFRMIHVKDSLRGKVWSTWTDFLDKYQTSIFHTHLKRHILNPKSWRFGSNAYSLFMQTGCSASTCEFSRLYHKSWSCLYYPRDPITWYQGSNHLIRGWLGCTITSSAKYLGSITILRRWLYP